jgi:hypothetical protein
MDRSHGTLYPRSELSSVLAQVMHYLEELDANRFGIQSKTPRMSARFARKSSLGATVTRTRWRLRRWNGHLHRVEVLTFDQLVRIARQVTLSLEHIMTPSQGVGTAGSVQTTPPPLESGQDQHGALPKFGNLPHTEA